MQFVNSLSVLTTLVCISSGCMMDAQGPESALTGAAAQLAAEHVPLCMERSSQIALFGDSYIDWVSHRAAAASRAPNPGNHSDVCLLQRAAL